jgi:hypothetical protein
MPLYSCPEIFGVEPIFIQFLLEKEVEWKNNLNVARYFAFMCKRGTIVIEIGKGHNCKDSGVIERVVILENLD